MKSGVAHNEIIAGIIRRVIEDNGLKFYVHNVVPPGDGGIYFGQACVAAQLAARGVIEQPIFTTRLNQYAK